MLLVVRGGMHLGGTGDLIRGEQQRW
jgi:hypothetical protein